MKWAYGITCVSSRFGEILPRTLESLRRSGFDSPRLFVDGLKSEDELPTGLRGLPVTTRWPNVRIVANWMLSLWELYLREPTADRYAVFQDDFVTCRNLKGYLEQTPYPGKGYLNLYTFPENQRLSKNRIGFYESNQLGKGAVALVFDADAARKMLTHPHMVQKVQCPKRGMKAVDGGIVTSMKQLGYKEFVHNSSLVQHIGLTSSMGNRRHPLAQSFPGEDFDALSLIPTPHVFLEEKKVRSQELAVIPEPTPVAPVPVNITPPVVIKEPPMLSIGLCGPCSESLAGTMNRDFASSYPFRWLLTTDLSYDTVPPPQNAHVRMSSSVKGLKQFLHGLDALLFIGEPDERVLRVAVGWGVRTVCLPLTWPYAEPPKWSYYVDTFLCADRGVQDGLTDCGLLQKARDFTPPAPVFSSREIKRCNRFVFISPGPNTVSENVVREMINLGPVPLVVVSRGNQDWGDDVWVRKDWDDGMNDGDVLISPSSTTLPYDVLRAAAKGVPTLLPDVPRYAGVPKVEMPKLTGEDMTAEELSDACLKLLGTDVLQASVKSYGWSLLRNWTTLKNDFESLVVSPGLRR